MRTGIAFLAAAVIGTLLALSAGASGASSPDPNMIYWGDNSAGKISEANLDGSGNGSTLNIGSARVALPDGVAIDAAANKIYWANFLGNSIASANLDGSGGSIVTIADPSLVDGPGAIAVDPLIHKIFWTNEMGGPTGAGSIAEANEDGTDPQLISTGGATVNNPQGIAVDPTDNKIFWANDATNTISFADLSNSGIGGDLTITGTASPVSNPVGVAVDPTAQKIYWADAVPVGHISSASFNGAGSKDLLTTGASPLSTPAGVAIDPAANKIYWADKGGGKISEANLDGTGNGHDLSTTGASATNPYFVALLEAPLGAGAPQITGGSTVGSSLTCTEGSWAPDLLSGFLYRVPHTFSFQWTLNGTAISGATSSTVTANAAGAYVCEVTAANQAGSATQTSTAFTVTGTPPPPPSTRPALTRVNQSHSQWREGSGLPSVASVRAPVGTTFRFTVNESVAVRFAFNQRQRGHTVTRGTLSFSVASGAHSVGFQGRVSKHKTLSSGRYTLVITVTAANGESAMKTLTFKIVKG